MKDRQMNAAKPSPRNLEGECDFPTEREVELAVRAGIIKDPNPKPDFSQLLDFLDKRES